MKRIELTTEWLQNWQPKRKDEEIADRGCKGLVVRGQPGGVKTLYRWASERDPGGGKARRKRVRLGRWPSLSLSEARKMVNDARETKHAESAGADLSVKQIAEAYRRDVLSHRERADEAWNIVRVHVVEAKPDPRRPAFGEWPARMVRPADLATVVRYAKEPRTVEAQSRSGEVTTRRLGGPGVARVVLRELKALFAHAVETGSLEMTPAGVMRARSFGLRATSRNRILDAEELKAFFAALDLTALLDGTAKPWAPGGGRGGRPSPTIRLALAFQLYTPLRSHSLIGARWEEFDLDAARWTVPVERLKLHSEDRATARPFVVPLPATAVAILRALRALAGSSPWVLASPLPPEEGEEPKHVEPKALVRALSRLQGDGRLAFGAKLTVHDLRRTWRSLAMDLGIDHAVARLSLGHAGLQGVEGVYGRAQMVEQRAQAAGLVGAALDRIRLGQAAAVVPLRERAPGGEGRVPAARD